MNKEIERRWLVTKLELPTSLVDNVLDIKQAYLDVPNQLRVRITTPSNDKPWAELTSKLGKGISRIEINTSVSLDAAQMLIETTPYVISKTRYEIDGWELDFFHGPLEGVILLEREYKGPETDEIIWPLLPQWIQEAVEVTETLTNRQLAISASIIESDSITSLDLTQAIPKIVLTGGPCAGKSSIIERLKFDSSYHVVPEIATILMGQIGVTPDIGVRNFQRILYKLQKSLEDAALKQAIKDGKKAVILDRGSLDSAAFVKGGLTTLSNILGISVENELSSYDAVILLEVLGKDDYEKFKDSNPVRRESWEEAIKVHESLYEVWALNHKNVYVASSNQTLDEKEKYVRTVIALLEI